MRQVLGSITEGVRRISISYTATRHWQLNLVYTPKLQLVNIGTNSNTGPGSNPDTKFHHKPA